MSVHIGPYTFDHASYDEARDVLYLSIGQPRDAADSQETPEGHIVRCDDHEQIIGVTLVNAKWLLDRDDSLAITFPRVRPLPTRVSFRPRLPLSSAEGGGSLTPDPS